MLSLTNLKNKLGNYLKAKGAVDKVKDGEKLIEDLFIELEKLIVENEKVKTPIGTFSLENRKERSGVNPRTREKIIIEAKKILKFTPKTKKY